MVEVRSLPGDEGLSRERDGDIFARCGLISPFPELDGRTPFGLEDVRFSAPCMKDTAVYCV